MKKYVYFYDYKNKKEDSYGIHIPADNTFESFICLINLIGFPRACQYVARWKADQSTGEILLDF